MDRSSGVILNISSLPSEYGIGGFGSECGEFAEFLKDMGFSYWQILPLDPLGSGFSPYDSDSAFGGNTLYISPELLWQDGLISLSDRDAAKYGGSPFSADYVFAVKNTEKLCKRAYNRLSQYDRDIIFNSLDEEVRIYAFYLALREKNGGKPFREWKECGTYQNSIPFLEDCLKPAMYYGFLQWLFANQWKYVKEEVNKTGIKFLGDMPFYVSADSCDIWAHPEIFNVDMEPYAVTLKAGVPPDFFSAEGQLWGNPTYNWNSLGRTGYSWWIRRIKRALSLYDTVRIDHFRGLSAYWGIQPGETTAKNGKWYEGPGMKLFDKLNETMKNPSIIAEDLGVYDEGVEKLLKDTGFAGMRVFQFGFDGSDSPHMVHNWPENSVGYTGTHDNNTLLGWLFELMPEVRRTALAYAGYKGENWGEGGYQSPACRAIIETVLRSNSLLAMVNFPDLCGFGSDTRMNIPGKAEGCWRYRASRENFERADREYYKNINKLFKRV